MPAPLFPLYVCAPVPSEDEVSAAPAPKYVGKKTDASEIPFSLSLSLSLTTLEEGEIRQILLFDSGQVEGRRFGDGSGLLAMGNNSNWRNCCCTQVILREKLWMHRKQGCSLASTAYRYSFEKRHGVQLVFLLNFLSFFLFLKPFRSTKLFWSILLIFISFIL